MQSVEIRVRGRIDARWSAWFEDFAVTYTDAGQTVLTGQVADASALYGLLAKLRDLGLPLISVTHLNADSER